MIYYHSSFTDFPMKTHWGRVTHICVGKPTIIVSDNGLSSGRRQAIIWTNAGILLIGPLGTNFREISIGIHTFSFKKMHSKISSAKWRPFCLGLNELTNWDLVTHMSLSQLCIWDMVPMKYIVWGLTASQHMIRQWRISHCLSICWLAVRAKEYISMKLYSKYKVFVEEYAFPMSSAKCWRFRLGLNVLAICRH